MEMYVIAWQSKETRNEGQGTAHFDLETAQAICTEANQEYPFLVHWPKRVDTTLAPTFEAVKDCPCVICHDDAEWLVNGYSLCGRHAIRMTTGRTYEQLQDEFDAEFEAEATPVLYPIVGMESTCDEETQPVEAIPTDSRYTCPVCGGAMVEMPPVPDGIDDPSWHLAYCEFMFTEPQTCRYAWSWHDDDGDDTLVLEA